MYNGRNGDSGAVSNGMPNSNKVRASVRDQIFAPPDTATMK